MLGLWEALSTCIWGTIGKKDHTDIRFEGVLYLDHSCCNRQRKLNWRSNFVPQIAGGRKEA